MDNMRKDILKNGIITGHKLLYVDVLLFESLFLSFPISNIYLLQIIVLAN